MKMNLPLPKEKEQYVFRSVSARLGYPFRDSILYNVHFTQSDVDYIEKTIKANKLYRLIKQEYIADAKTNDSHKRNWNTQIQFFNLFLNDPKCPKNVQYFLGHHIGWLYFCMNSHKEETKTAEQFLMDRWMEKCR